jgi:hypothetical protein
MRIKLNASELTALIKEQERKKDCLLLEEMKAELESLKSKPKKIVDESTKHNDKGFSRFHHIPSNMVWTGKGESKKGFRIVKGYINIDGQLWDWNLGFALPKPVVQKKVFIKPVPQ